MYAAVPVIIHSKLDAPSMAVWLSLCSFCKWERDSKGEPIISKADSCFPTLAAIAVRANISIPSVRRALRNLERLGYVRTAARYGKRNKGENGEQRSNGYTLYSHGDAPIGEP